VLVPLRQGFLIGARQGDVEVDNGDRPVLRSGDGGVHVGWPVQVAGGTCPLFANSSMRVLLAGEATQSATDGRGLRRAR
jgi:hypothetical protein